MIGVSETPYDLRFHALGIPVRVHPLFWLTGALLAGRSNDLSEIVLWIACVFVSILVHEYGHGLTAKQFGGSPSIVLWMGGGLCYSHKDYQTPLQRLAVVLWGPGAGFVLCALVMAVYSALFGLTPREHLSIVRELLGLPADPGAVFSTVMKLGINKKVAGTTGTNFTLYWYMVQINIIWGLVNLLPVWPLDGGRVSEIVLSTINPREGARWGHILSLLVAGVLAFVMYAVSQRLFLAIFFGYFGVVNYQILQSMHRAHSYGLDNDEDWWRR
jgi:stage IV sporulation protein FB